MMLRGLPRTPASSAIVAPTLRNPTTAVTFADENVVIEKGMTTAKTPLATKQLQQNRTTGDKLNRSGGPRRMALGDISNRKKAPTATAKETSVTVSKSSTTKKKASINTTNATTTTNNNVSTNTQNATRKPTTKRVNFPASLREPALETTTTTTTKITTKPRVLFSVPTPIPKRHLLGKTILNDTLDSADGTTMEEVEDVERPAGRLWSAEEHFGDDDDDPRDDISLEDSSRYFMTNLRSFVKEARADSLHRELRRQDEAAKQFMEQSWPRILQEQWNEDLAALEWNDLVIDEPLDLSLDYDDDFDEKATFFVHDISF